MHRAATDGDNSTVFVIDPDPTTGAMVEDLVGGSNLRCEIFTACRDFLAAFGAGRTGCLVLEHRIADMSGLQLQRRLAASGALLPLVFVMADPNVSTAVELMRGGAVHILEKPVRSIELLTAIQEALTLDQGRRHAAQCREQIKDLVATLSAKEREVFDLIGRGKSIKSMAADLELSVRAIEQRRHSLMEKLAVESPLELMRFSVMAQRTVEAGNGTNSLAAATRFNESGELKSGLPGKLAPATRHSGTDLRDRLGRAPMRRVPR